MTPFAALLVASLAAADPEPLAPGNHARTLTVDGTVREYLVHVPRDHDVRRPVPVVLALHGAGMNGPMMAGYTGLNAKSDDAGFVVVYPSGTGLGSFRTWNAGGMRRSPFGKRADDVEFVRRLLDELGTVVLVDPDRIYACGMSNGGMMCYRLAAELSDRIAAIAPVAGTNVVEESRPVRPVSVLHVHGTRDELVPFELPPDRPVRVARFRGAEESVRIWVGLDGCDEQPATDVLSQEGDETKVVRSRYANGKEGSEVVLVVVEGGGHTWPGRPNRLGFLGKAAQNVSANDLLWDFFVAHPRKK